jgi:hypothetical protein
MRNSHLEALIGEEGDKEGVWNSTLPCCFVRKRRVDNLSSPKLRKALQLAPNK